MSGVRLLGVLLLLALAGCGGTGGSGGSGDAGRSIDGAVLAREANAQLEAENPDLVHGDLTCAAVRQQVGATSRCTRTVGLSGGRWVRIGATVRIDRVDGGVHFAVVVDDDPQAYGLTGASVADDLRTQYAATYAGSPRVTCPDLPGRVGAAITCRLAPDPGKGPLEVVVTVTKVDAASFDTDYRYAVQD